MQACADGKKDVVESNEDDNCLTSSGTVKVTGPPDLAVTAVTVKDAPLTVARGGSLTITVVAEERRRGRRRRIDDEVPARECRARTAKNLSGTVAAPAAARQRPDHRDEDRHRLQLDTAIGTYTVRACADSLDVVVEASEANCLDTGVVVTVQ